MINDFGLTNDEEAVFTDYARLQLMGTIASKIKLFIECGGDIGNLSDCIDKMLTPGQNGMPKLEEKLKY